MLKSLNSVGLQLNKTLGASTLCVICSTRENISHSACSRWQFSLIVVFNSKVYKFVLSFNFLVCLCVCVCVFQSVGVHT